MRKPKARKVECCKCGSTDIHTLFRAKGSDAPDWIERGRPECYEREIEEPSFRNAAWRRDLLTRHCRNCQYDWIEDTKDRVTITEARRARR